MRSGLEFLAAADAGSLPDAALADCLKGLELAAAAHTAARARILAAFSARGVFEDGARSARSWLVGQTRTTKAAAGASVTWMRRLAVHPRIAQALGVAAVSESWARQQCDWSDLLPPDVRDDADTIFPGAAAAGVELAGLSALAEEMYARTAGPDSDDDDGFAERSLQLDLHWRGRGRLTGQLTPACAAALSAVLDSLGKKAGPEDARTRAQRDHDALEESCRRLSTSGLPDSAGQPAQILLHMTLSQLRDLVRTGSGPVVNACDDGAPGTVGSGQTDSVTEPTAAAGPTALADRAATTSCPATTDCAASAAAGLAGPADPTAVAAPDVATSQDDDGAGPWADDAWLPASGTAAGTAGWLSDAAAVAYACDAAITPVVSGTIDPMCSISS